MSLLDRGNYDVVVYPEVETVDSDGNPFLRVSETGIPARVMIQPMPQSGTSARRAEQDNEGFETEELYRMRFRRGHEVALGIRSLVEWNGQSWTIYGLPTKYRGSKRTWHWDYTLRRT